MIDYDMALARALKYLSEFEVPVEIISQGEFSEGWYFCYQSVEFLKTGEFSDQLVGNGPVVVDRFSGKLHVMGTHKPLRLQLEDYVATKGRYS
ncbi:MULTISPECIES: YrhB domain-containing protein [unclassified Pseudomonas]|uniref:YrhB domain-containing protein n=1 Tax=unclassified Pseudomonas TaxID=196821 RepID=UPI000C88BBBB|nr:MULTISPECIES: YrhB domain-containing protein [unclassified Pseudomonas]PMZ96084.1 hypothetical protein C1X79_12895 [Pseudomonas sp. FW305-42]PNA24416.1 hypothetical protein C1X78_10945 [Pseudomonas sp. MPR-R1B]PNB25123.1 hypothetical protein C1X80_14685 [Pseudomonas sp. DP16D-E2]PNB42515.1 hypothetical protein C1X75_15350 [Pseudomonas sp. FW305-17]PNB59336.1 hypothetical protein C1X77_16595 [Pseudomonas sp. GW531-E2]